MSTRQHMDKQANIADRENLTRRAVKVGVVKPPTRGRVLGELGNKIHDQQPSQSTITKKPAIIGFGASEFAKPKSTTIVTTKSKTTAVTKTATTSLIKTSEVSLKKSTTLVKHVTQVQNDPKTRKESTSYSTKQLVGIIDPDANDKSDPFLVAEYVQDIFSHLRDLESQFAVKDHYLATHRTTPRMRAVLINWLVDVHLNFKFLQETLHLSIAVLDRYLQLNNNVGRETLQLVGTAATIIAAKYEEMHLPEIIDFEYLCDNTFTRSQILRMEQDILCKLKWNLGRPLSLHFVRRYNKIARVQHEHHSLSKYLLEIFLLEYKLCHIKPSIQAAAASCLSVSIINEVSDPAKVWTKTLAYYSTYKYSDIKPVVITLAYFLDKMETLKYQAVRKKYATAEFHKISLSPKLHGPLVKRLTDEAQVSRAKS